MTFRIAPGKRMSPRRLCESVEICSYFTDLYRNGQIVGERNYSVHRGVYHTYVETACADSLEPKYNSEWVNNSLERVVKATGLAPEWEVIDDDAPTRSPNWRTAPYLYLCHAPWDMFSPVRRGNNGAHIPLYLLPVDQWVRQEICGWRSTQEWCNELWYDSGEMELIAYRQMADPARQFVKKGRSLCKTIEEATGKPTYYVLPRLHGRKTGEEKRPCPGCGRQWRIKGQAQVKDLKDLSWERRFDFRCEPCRLLSWIPNACDGESLARVGEFKQKATKRKA